jgi:hypothetical protein
MAEQEVYIYRFLLKPAYRRRHEDRALNGLKLPLIKDPGTVYLAGRFAGLKV